MILTELGNPKIRPERKCIREFVYQRKEQIFLPPPSNLPKSRFFSTIVKRRSRREFHDLSTADLSNVLWFTCKTLEAINAPAGRWQHRCSPSAGGIHPIDVLISTPQKNESEIFIYNPISHSLGLLFDIKLRPLQLLLAQINQVVPIGRATVIWFVAQFQRTCSKYENGESLVWRDSGALLANFCIVSEALALNCCAIGATGNPYVQQIFDEREKLRGVGGCLIGSRSKRF